MSHHCSEQPATVAELVAALLLVDQTLEVYETWNETPGWFEIDTPAGRFSKPFLWLGTMKCETLSDDNQCRNRP